MNRTGKVRGEFNHGCPALLLGEVEVAREMRHHGRVRPRPELQEPIQRVHSAGVQLRAQACLSKPHPGQLQQGVIPFEPFLKKPQGKRSAPLTIIRCSCLLHHAHGTSYFELRTSDFTPCCALACTT